MPLASKSFTTIDARPDSTSMVKPGEMIDVIEMSPLTLTDRRIYNLLIENAWEAIDQPVTHTIELRAIRSTRDANDRVGESVERLMAHHFLYALAHIFGIVFMFSTVVSILACMIILRHFSNNHI